MADRDTDAWLVIVLAELELLARYVLKIAPTDPEPEEVTVAKRILARRRFTRATEE